MTNRSEDTERKVNKTLESLDGMKRASTKPFLMTRLESRIQDRLLSAKEERMIKYLVPTMLSLILMINIFVFSDSTGHSKPNTDETINQLGESYFDMDYLEIDLTNISNESK